ncbi:MAG: hypothetical protein ACXVPN_03935 [Bacteroidia bacterium]
MCLKTIISFALLYLICSFPVASFAQMSGTLSGKWKLVGEKKIREGVEVKSVPPHLTLYLTEDGFLTYKKKPDKMDYKWTRADTVINLISPYSNKPTNYKLIIKKLTNDTLVLFERDGVISVYNTYKKR